MDRLDNSWKGSRAGRDNMPPKRVVKKPPFPSKDNGRQVVTEAKDVYPTRSTLNNRKGHEISALGQRDKIQINLTPTSTSTSTKEENDKISGNGLFVRRLSQTGVGPGSQEFQSVLRCFISPTKNKVVKPKSQVAKTKCRKISLNDFGKASRMTKRSEDMSLGPRPKRSLDMLNAPTISSINRAVDHRKIENNGKPAQSRRSFPFSNIKEAWQESESSFQGSKVERRRHVSLPAPPPGFYLDNKRKEETLVESFKAEKTTRKDSKSSSSVRSNRKISTVLSPSLQNMSSVSTASSRGTAVSETNETITDLRKISSGIGNLGSCSEAYPETESYESQTRKISPTLNTELSKIKQISAANGHDLHPKLLLGIKSKQAGSNGELLDEFGSTDDSTDEQQATLRARKNFQRIGKAAVAARRFLGIHNRETAGAPKHQHHRGISPLAKSDKPFNEMMEEMKYSYQGLRLGNKADEAEEEKSCQTEASELNDYKSR